MKIEKFEDLIAWQKAKELTTKLYDSCKNCKEYGLKDITTKTGVIIMNQIAEGFEKRNNKDIKAAFLEAKGGTSQMRSMLYLLLDLGCITQEEFKNFYDTTRHITKMLMAFVKSINVSEKKREEGKEKCNKSTLTLLYPPSWTRQGGNVSPLIRGILKEEKIPWGTKGDEEGFVKNK